MNSSRLGCIVCCLRPGIVSGRCTAPGDGRPDRPVGRIPKVTELYAESFLLHLTAGQDHDFAYLLRQR